MFDEVGNTEATDMPADAPDNTISPGNAVTEIEESILFVTTIVMVLDVVNKLSFV